MKFARLNVVEILAITGIFATMITAIVSILAITVTVCG